MFECALCCADHLVCYQFQCHKTENICEACCTTITARAYAYDKIPQCPFCLGFDVNIAELLPIYESTGLYKTEFLDIMLEYTNQKEITTDLDTDIITRLQNDDNRIVVLNYANNYDVDVNNDVDDNNEQYRAYIVNYDMFDNYQQFDNNMLLPVVRSLNEWICSSCTFINLPDTYMCEICRTSFI